MHFYQFLGRFSLSYIAKNLISQDMAESTERNYVLPIVVFLVLLYASPLITLGYTTCYALYYFVYVPNFAAAKPASKAVEKQPSE